MSRRKTRITGELRTILSTYDIRGEIHISKRSVHVIQHADQKEIGKKITSL